MPACLECNDESCHHHYADLLQAAEADKVKAEAVVSHLNEIIATAEKNMADQMIGREVPKFTFRGKTYGVNSETRIRPVDGHQDEVVQWIKEHGGSDLVKPSMHWARRDSFLREQFLDDDGCATEIPAELAGMLHVESFPKISARKA